jgi:hypothetical protein
MQHDKKKTYATAQGLSARPTAADSCTTGSLDEGLDMSLPESRLEKRVLGIVMGRTAKRAEHSTETSQACETHEKQ